MKAQLIALPLFMAVFSACEQPIQEATTEATAKDIVAQAEEKRCPYDGPAVLDFISLDGQGMRRSDLIVPGIELFRGEQGGVFNKAVEAEPGSTPQPSETDKMDKTELTGDQSPKGTLWSAGPTGDGKKEYLPWRAMLEQQLMGGPGEVLPGAVTSLYIPSKGLYFDVVWKQYTNADGGASFGYTRTFVPGASGCK
jgi:hypothetical protein